MNLCNDSHDVISFTHLWKVNIGFMCMLGEWRQVVLLVAKLKGLVRNTICRSLRTDEVTSFNIGFDA
jgi:hypothetical protein